jgi:ABC-type uncharacterized transport system permease subunit
MKSARRFTLTSLALSGALSGLAGIATTALSHSDDNEGLRSGMVINSSN